jgi:predicted TIM-barrel fold metal-dependent hydrolase
MDDMYLEIGDSVPDIDRLPSEIIEDNFYFTTQPLDVPLDNPSYVGQITKMLGPDSVLYSSDLPHVDFDPPEELIACLRSDFDQDTIQNIMGGTAANLFGMEV